MGRLGRQGQAGRCGIALIQMGDRRGWSDANSEIADASGKTAARFANKIGGAPLALLTTAG